MAKRTKNGSGTPETRNRWRRVYGLRRAIVPHVLMAGQRAPDKTRGEKGPQPYVVMTDDLDDVLYAALDVEARIAEQRARRRKGTA